MKMPKTISGWCMILFFLLFGINAFVPMSILTILVGILALATAVFTFLGM